MLLGLFDEQLWCFQTDQDVDSQELKAMNPFQKVSVYE